MKNDIIHLADVRQRLEAEREDAVAPIRNAFMAEFGELLEDYLAEINAATGGDVEKELQELTATCSTMLALAAEEHFDDLDEQVEFIETVSEIAVELLEEDCETLDMFEDQ